MGYRIISGTLRIPTNNYIEMALGEGIVEPGTNQTITFKTHPGSTIAMRGVDQSLLLLSRDKALNDIPPSQVPFNPFYHTYHKTSFNPTADDFDQSDLILMTNSNDHVRSKRSTVGNIESRYRPTLSDYTYFDEAIRTRTHFPETWLWNELLAKDFTTTYSENVPIVPDTITSWYVTALSLNRQSGLAVTQAPSLLTVFRPFFITLNLPYAITQGEQFELQVLVHNYFDHTLQVLVTFFNNANQIRFVDSRELRMDNVSRLITIEKATVGNVSFVIMPIVSGDIPLSLQAVTDVAGDAIIRNVKVEIPGAKMWDSVKTQLYDGPTATHSENYTIQRKRTRRNTQHKLTVSGTPLDTQTGISDSHLQVNDLLELPSGCGEQTMSKFLKNVLALDWLRVNQKKDPASEAKAIKNLATGYQLQMKFYNHRDGSFQYFPASQNKDSTWLTAYVLRGLTQASKYITIDHKVLIKGLHFLLSKQDTKTGQFKGTGSPVYGGNTHGMRESTSSNYGLTAYVTLAIIEITSELASKIERAEKIKFDVAKARGLNYISAESSLMESDLYNLILVTTTLAAAGHDSRHLFFEKMQKSAKTNEDGALLRWWQLTPGNPEPVPSSLIIEMTAYALLAHIWMNRDKAAESLPIVRWLLKQKQEGGGFQTTQDTVVALTALSKFAERTISGSGDDAVSISVWNKDETIGEFMLNRTNRDAPHQFVLPSYLEDNQFTVMLKGKGKAFIQYTEVHYTEKISNTTNYYQITGKLTKDLDADKEDVFNLEFCLQLRNRSYDASHQIVAEIKLPTGFAFEDDDILGPLKRAKNTTVEKIEFKDKHTAASVYYDHLNFPNQCVVFPVHIYIRSTSRYKGTIRVTDYYNPTRTDTSTIYPDRITTVCEICLVTGECDVISGCL